MDHLHIDVTFWPSFFSWLCVKLHICTVANEFFITTSPFWKWHHIGTALILWSFSYSQTCLEKKSSTTCVMHMKRFRDCSGTFELVSMSGFEKFARTVGVYKPFIHLEPTLPYFFVLDNWYLLVYAVKLGYCSKQIHFTLVTNALA